MKPARMRSKRSEYWLGVMPAMVSSPVSISSACAAGGAIGSGFVAV
jgi:hypothetical protein